jgi:hypothetical protein
MALQDHFRPPLSVRRHWHAFHNAWAANIAADLNAQLPEGYFAEPNVQFGIEIDVATFEESPQASSHDVSQWGTMPRTSMDTHGAWSPPAPVYTIPLLLVSDTVEVMVFNSDAGITLAGAIELISPANKDRPAHRSAFVSKCETYLQQGVGLVVVDVVTGRSANLHNDLLARLAAPPAVYLHVELYAAAYRPVERNGQPSLDIWQETLGVGDVLPSMPLWLRGALSVQVALAATYERTCREQRITVSS